MAEEGGSLLQSQLSPLGLEGELELAAGVPDVVFVQAGLLGEALAALRAGVGAGGQQLQGALVGGLVAAQVGELAEALAAVGALVGQAAAGGVAQPVTLVADQLAEAAAAVGALEGGAQAVRAVRGRGGGVPALVADEGAGALEGLAADEADEEGVAQILLHKVLGVLPLHMPLLELLVREGDQAVEALVGTQAI